MSNSSEINARIGVASRIERLPDTKVQMFMCGVILICWLVETIDLGGIAYLMPVLGKHFSINSITLGYMGSMSLIGMAIGSALIGNFVDKYGRKKMLMITMVIWGLAGFGMACSWSLTSLFVFRFILGLGLGAQVIPAMTMLSEMCSSKQRGKYLTLYMMFLPIGYSLAGLLTYLVLPNFGWRWVFFVEALPALWFFMVWKVVPESAFWLESKSRFTEADEIVTSYEERVKKCTGKPLPPIKEIAKVHTENGTFMELLSSKYVKVFIMNAIWYFCAMLGFYGLTYWLSALLVAKGFTITKSILYLSTICLGGVPAFLLARYGVDTLGRKWSLVIVSIGTAIAAYIYGQSVTVIMIIATGLIYQFVQSSLNMVNAVYTPELYPTHIRGTGVGTVQAIGRVGSFVGPIFMGYVMTGYGAMAVFAAGAFVFVIAGLVIAALGPETKGRVF